MFEKTTHLDDSFILSLTNLIDDLQKKNIKIENGIKAKVNLMKQTFLLSVEEIIMANEHCVTTSIEFASCFIDVCLDVDHLCNLPHRRSKESKSLI